MSTTTEQFFEEAMYMFSISNCGGKIAVDANPDIWLYKVAFSNIILKNCVMLMDPKMITQILADAIEKVDLSPDKQQALKMVHDWFGI